MRSVFVFSLWGAYLRGKRDGKRGQPQANQTLLPPYVTQLKDLAERMMNDVAVDWREADIKLKPRYCVAKREYERAVAASHAALDSKKKEHTEFEEAKKDALEKSAHPRLRWNAYVFWAVVIAILEYPMNALVFQVFGQGQWETRLISAFLVVTIPLAGHLLGEWLREETFLHKRILLIKVICLVVIVVSVLGGISYLRELFVEETMQELLDQPASGTTMTLLFFAFNMLAFLIVTALSYNAHDVHPDMPKARERLSLEQRELRQAVAVAAQADRALEHAADAFAKIAAYRRAVFDKKVEKAREIKNRVDVLVQEYWVGNLRVRQDGATPKAYETPLKVEMPEALRALDEQCDQAAAGATAPPKMGAAAAPTTL